MSIFFSDLSSGITKVSKSISEALAPLLEVNKTIQNVLKSNNVHKVLSDFKEFAEGTQAALDVFSDLMKFSGYPPNLSLDLYTMLDIADIGIEYAKGQVGNQEVVNKINSIMVTTYDENALNSVKESILKTEINSLIGREILINQVFEAHVNGYYSLTVPSLVMQFEGLILKEYGFSRKLKTRYFKEVIKDLFGLSDHFHGYNAYQFYEKEILASQKSDLNRHGIAHGSYLPEQYSKEDISLKLILALEYIVYHLSILSEEDKQRTRNKIDGIIKKENEDKQRERIRRRGKR